MNKDVHLHLVISTKMMEEIERYRRRQKFLSASRSESLRQLILAGLKASKPPRQTRQPRLASPQPQPQQEAAE